MLMVMLLYRTKECKIKFLSNIYLGIILPPGITLCISIFPRFQRISAFSIFPYTFILYPLPPTWIWQVRYRVYVSMPGQRSTNKMKKEWKVTTWNVITIFLPKRGQEFGRYPCLEKRTVCPKSSDPFYVVTSYIQWVTTSWTYSILHSCLLNWSDQPLRSRQWKQNICNKKNILKSFRYKNHVIRFHLVPT